MNKLRVNKKIRLKHKINKRSRTNRFTKYLKK